MFMVINDNEVCLLLPSRSVRAVQGSNEDRILSSTDINYCICHFFEALQRPNLTKAHGDFHNIHSVHDSVTNSAEHQHHKFDKKSNAYHVTARKHGRHVHEECLEQMYQCLGFCIERRASTISGGGRGVFVTQGKVSKGTVVALYPGLYFE